MYHWFCTPDDMICRMAQKSTRPGRRRSIRLAAEPVSVPGARRFVRDGLHEWGLVALEDVATLCTSELAANAALHSGSRFMDVTLDDLGGAVEVAVLDEGAFVGAESVTPRTSPAMRSSSPPLATEPSTGRGLAIVSMLSHDWGVVDEEGRRRVWAVLVPDEETRPVRPPRREEHPEQSGGFELPEGWKLVVVPQAPVELSVRIDNQIDDVIRELQLVDSTPRSPSGELAALIQQLLSVPFARHAGRAQGLQALEEGKDRVDIRLPMPREAAPDIRELLVAMRQADQLYREHQLLGVPATPEMDQLREWYTHNMVTQLEDDAEPIGFDEWIASRRGRGDQDSAKAP